MPLYDLQCKKCENILEVLVGLSEVPAFDDAGYADFVGIVKCQKCKGTIFKKMPTAHGKSSINWSEWRTNSKGK